MVIETEVSLSRDEVYKLIKDHMRTVHKLEVDSLKMKTSNNGFNGFDLKIMRIQTSMEEMHKSTPAFEALKEKIVI